MAIPILNPTTEEVNAVLSPLEAQEEADYEAMICALYESRDDITDGFDDRRYWL